jgi:hypothetical protein
MIPSIRTAYNQQFTPAKYEAFLKGMAQDAQDTPAFRVAETPVFVPRALTNKLVQACEEIVNVILRPDFKAITHDAIPHALKVANENEHPHFIIIDFAVCYNDAGELVPQLIELQGFPTMFAFQDVMARQFREHFNIPEGVNNFFNGFNSDSYFKFLRELIVGPYPTEEVVLLEVEPEAQKTRVDFYSTEKYIGIRSICISDLIQDGKKLYYLHNHREIPIKRIYNRVIFDDIEKHHSKLSGHINLFQDLDVEWITHPNWFYRISKYTLPFIHSEYVPKSWFLHQLPVVPNDLENYVLKPLFSYAGQGVIIDVTQADIDAIEDPQNWILQHKVQYAPAIETPSGPAKCEIRMMYAWTDNAPRPILIHNLARISKGKMIGVSFNDKHDWVGGSCCFFEH